MKHKQWLYMLLMIFGFSCKTIVDTPKSFEGDKVMFGNGGGFTGAVTTHVLLDNGQMFTSKSRGEESWNATKALDRNTTKNLLEQAAALNLGVLNHNHPGNTYKFIRYVHEGKEAYICWGDSNHPVSDAVSDFYKTLIATVKPAE